MRTEFHRRAGIEVSSLPKPLWLGDLEKNRVISVPGVQYKALTAVAGLLPRSFRAASTEASSTHPEGLNMIESTADRDRLAELVRELAVVHGKVILSSGKEADYYVDLRRATLQHQAAPLIGKLLRELVSDWEFDAVGGLTMGADPVALAVLHAPGRPLDAFVVRKAAKTHGMQRQIEGPDVAGKRVLVVEDTTTTGNSPLTAVRALRDAGATVVGVATVVDRETGADQVIAAEGLEYRSILSLKDLSLG
ncbi:orotate phosphoribosyltransferase [Nocardia pseudobrasiliensis]|uniref:Orotate phosphoribosyltransferase n=2 Tax=Nocardia pseudobrasiliensis TaxID=45979 RepID=A0A370HXL8_9NOCA|nr:orotate phosphoribosyltransferase [Nocardia pseudobrasiliensis]